MFGYLFAYTCHLFLKLYKEKRLHKAGSCPSCWMWHIREQLNTGEVGRTALGLKLGHARCSWFKHARCLWPGHTRWMCLRHAVSQWNNCWDISKTDGWGMLHILFAIQTLWERRGQRHICQSHSDADSQEWRGVVETLKRLVAYETTLGKQHDCFYMHGTHMVHDPGKTMLETVATVRMEKT